MDLFDNIHKNSDKPSPGKVLISEPFLFDTNFKKSVILLCEHQENNGSLGFILNRKLEVGLNDVMDIDVPVHIPLYFGGPVQNNTLHFLHSDEERSAKSVPLGNGIYWGGNFDELLPLLEMGILDKEKYRFFLGYSGWGKSQLNDEFEINSWIIAKATQKMVFGEDVERLWKNTLNSMGGSYKVLANYPESPFLN